MFLAFPEDLSKIDLMYEEIKSKVVGELGCACFVFNFVSNDFRRKVVHTGLAFGFKKVQIINWVSELYIDAIFQSKYKPKNDEVVWIFRGDECYVWKKENNIAKYYGQSFQDFIEQKDFEKVKRDTKLDEFPNIILCNFKFEKGFLEDYAPDAQIFSYTQIGSKSSAVFVKTQIMAGVSDVTDFDANTISDSFSLQIGNKKLFLRATNLPFAQSRRLKLKEEDKNIQVNYLL